MDTLDDELDFKHHRLKPDVYYRCPTLESLEGALQNELQKNAESLIPVEIVTEFVFGAGSTITVPVVQQENLGALGFAPTEFPQIITVEQALCRDIQGKERLKTQRAIARSFIEVVQAIDGFKYSERQAFNKDGTDGARFKYVCIDSLQKRDRKSNAKKENDGDSTEKRPRGRPRIGPIPTYDCGGAIHFKFSTKRDAINVIYKHNPIHRDVESRPTNSRNGSNELPAIQTEDNTVADTTAPLKRKRGRPRKVPVDQPNGYEGPTLDMSTSPELTKSTLKKKRRKTGTATSPEVPKTSAKKQKKGKNPNSPSKSRSSMHIPDPVPPPAAPLPVKGPCVRCKEKKIKCNEMKLTCNQCQRGLWECHYEAANPKKQRSKNGCLNCRQRKRKCSEENPACAYCLKIDDDCEYPE